MRRGIANVAIAVTLGILAFVASTRLLPNLDRDLGLRPYDVGRIGPISIRVAVADVAVPNQIGEGEDGLSWNPRIRLWDAYLITAPVPEVVGVDSLVHLSIPWTTLPNSVTAVVSRMDPVTGRRLERWLQLKGGPIDWAFERMGTFTIEDTTSYGTFTGVKYIYAVNLFEFAREFGSDYRSNMKRAVSSAVKTVLEDCAARRVRSLAIPALAGAEHVLERPLVLSYESSFRSILEGVERATTGNTINEVILVIWLAPALQGHPEFSAAVAGVEKAAYVAIPSWSGSLRRVTTAITAVGVLAGILMGYGTSGRRRLPAKALAVRVIALLPVIAGSFVLQGVLKVLPLTPWPSFDVAGVGVLAFVIGRVLHDVALPFEDASVGVDSACQQEKEIVAELRDIEDAAVLSQKQRLSGIPDCLKWSADDRWSVRIRALITAAALGGRGGPERYDWCDFIKPQQWLSKGQPAPWGRASYLPLAILFGDDDCVNRLLPPVLDLPYAEQEHLVLNVSQGLRTALVALWRHGSNGICLSRERAESCLRWLRFDGGLERDLCQDEQIRVLLSYSDLLQCSLILGRFGHEDWAREARERVATILCGSSIHWAVRDAAERLRNTVTSACEPWDLEGACLHRERKYPLGLAASETKRAVISVLRAVVDARKDRQGEGWRSWVSLMKCWGINSEIEEIRDIAKDVLDRPHDSVSR